VKGERTAWKIGADVNGSALPDIRTAPLPENRSNQTLYFPKKVALKNVEINLMFMGPCIVTIF
jgi:hypothetical protein